MKQRVYLGLDTSCYTTSVAVLAEDGRLLEDARRILSVKPGSCGLKQSEMVFQHTRNLPELLEEALLGKDYALAAVGVSGRPRPLADSYMPAFLAGLGAARALAAAAGVRLEVLSHQENHLEAGVWSAGGPEAERFLLLHASGGTTDLLLAERREDGRFHISRAGGSIDLHAGQFIDRIGVALKLQFPAGPALERLASAAADRVELPVAVRGLQTSLSGPCSAALRLLAAGAEPAALALGVEHVLAESFARLLRCGAGEYGVEDALLVGGVGSNRYIRSHLESRLAASGIRLWTPEPRFSCDNAAGCAALAWRTECP